jgi:uncharacterized protein
MIQLSEEIKKIIENVPVSFASSTTNGIPNCVVVSDIRAISPNQVIVADNFLNKTRKNIDINKNVALVVHSSDYKQAFQLKGTCEVFTDNDHRQKLIELFGDDPRWSKKATLIITITEIWNLANPKLIAKE